MSWVPVIVIICLILIFGVGPRDDDDHLR